MRRWLPGCLEVRSQWHLRCGRSGCGFVSPREAAKPRRKNPGKKLLHRSTSYKCSHSVLIKLCLFFVNISWLFCPSRNKLKQKPKNEGRITSWPVTRNSVEKSTAETRSPSAWILLHYIIMRTTICLDIITLYYNEDNHLPGYYYITL